jgi:ApbE superfamily uncharacterized protein (UPF0280 family)
MSAVEPAKRVYRTFVHKEAVFRICCTMFEAVTAEILRQRRILEEYISRHPDFKTALTPIEIPDDAPLSVQRMASSAQRVGVGPMAAVAGTMAQLAAEAGIAAGAEEAIVDNGGDICLKLTSPAVIGIYSGPDQKLNKLAFRVQPEQTPLSICSSSGRMGHSMSLGLCDLAAVVSTDAALADAAATFAANQVRTGDDIEPGLNRTMEIGGIDGVLIVRNGRIGMAGKLPELVKTQSAPNPFYA